MADSLCDDLNGEERTEELFNRIKFTFDLPVDEAALRLGTCSFLWKLLGCIERCYLHSQECAARC